ncbi:MFS transporter [Pseudomonas sp. WS 5111]|jgi:DHA1 family inner membrane transport protein|uniref:MFS transporter n=1 Tax=unclassified Pseudomonas TaxID=196821 RepID=UPI00147281E1|nr:MULTISPECIES: MFS transporter [unclassified Pseudomonas]NMX66186.1 MFS transporter [Pseudomonas sp. WS 5111]NMX85364.1 MFS transporter [Pseudomonas sp. WS 5010]
MTDSTKMPFQVWILTLAAFAIGTAEFVIAGILPQVAESLAISEGQTGSLITAYALSIVVGGPLLTLWLSRFEKRNVLLGLMVLFIVDNLITALSQDYTVLLISRVLAGLTQGPFYGIGAVVATRLVAPQMAGRAVGQMFAGLTLANVLGVPAGAWIGNALGWHAAFFVVAALGAVAAVAIATNIERQGQEKAVSVMGQLAGLRDRNLLASLLITVLSWVGFMTFYGYVAPFAEQVASIDRGNVTWVLMIVGIGLVIGNSLGGRTADANLRLSLIGWPLAMIASLVVAYLVSSNPYAFLLAVFAFGVTSFANVPALQMRVMNYGGTAPELAATANISAFNVANALGGMIGGAVIDSHFGAQAIPFAAAIIPIVGVLFILTQERKGPTAAVSLFK